ncbi:MAG: hypothetical protein EZS28_040718 [Streblomastix strix]|uniref:Uncharacterized protein n=1 Tax=Streblomastix strix TaxID=222440 RepID=A0A5J4TZP7_9EUKA|nr:MAG: hypothetical protein EZS28_040718 [Streblomastix strix]
MSSGVPEIALASVFPQGLYNMVTDLVLLLVLCSKVGCILFDGTTTIAVIGLNSGGLVINGGQFLACQLTAMSVLEGDIMK